MKSRIERLLILLPWLVNNPNHELQVVAETFDVSVKQLLDDLALLTFVGPTQYGGDLVDIIYDDNGVSVIDHQGLDQPVSLNNDQLSLLGLGLMVLADQASPEIRSTAISLANKLLGSHFTSTSDAAKKPQELTNSKDIVLSAIQVQRPVTFDYASGSNTASRSRVISATKFFLIQNNEYVAGMCHDSSSMRTFRLTKMLNLKEANQDIKFLPESVDFVESSKITMLKCVTTKDGLDFFTNFPNYQLIQDQGNQVLISFGIYHQDYGVKLGLGFRNCLRIIEPEYYEMEITKKIASHLGVNG